MLMNIKREFFTHYSSCLNREMHMLVYGTGGLPIIVFPCQDGMCDNWESFNMPETLQDYLEQGQVQLFCVDAVDKESWSDTNGDKWHRSWMQECYYHYIVDEVAPLVREWNPSGKMPIVTGFSLGAMHAAIVFLRRPDLFGGMLALSGCYDAHYFWGEWSNGLVYDNSPVDFLPNMPKDHYYIDMYNNRKIVICVGQGNWEEEGIRTTKILADNFAAKGIKAWVDFWGHDVDHDWPWWKVQIRYFLPWFLE